MPDTVLIWDDALAGYGFQPDHPLNPRRLVLTVELLRACGLLDDPGCIVSPRPAERAELTAVHTPEYVAMVERLSDPATDPKEGLAFGLGTPDTPVVEGMHDAARHVAGAALTAAEQVMTGAARRAFSIAGGLHHAREAEAAGFCVYNDLAVAIRWLREEFGARVMYIDYDAHHGDGVERIFAEDPDVLTVSFHESGAYLFPGTGALDDRGAGDGYGSAVNVPLEPHTEDASWRDAFRTLVPALADAFRPDVIVLQNGCDGHLLDPLAHLRATTALFEEFVRTVGTVADEHCDGRIVATGGGGYAIYTVVPRAWTLVWAALCEMESDQVPDALPADWVAAARRESGLQVPEMLRDARDAFEPWPRRAEVEAVNRRTVRNVERRALPLLTGWGLEY